ncbi:MAG: SH3 domain-containing protein [Leptolyngbyaceae cyanobacterium SM2_3_12]|nr:SH3 domain-containing protein [Leptolyngbyaceae cyanobacterium SM2_3_12]
MKQIVLALSISVLIAACQGTSAPPSGTIQELESISPEETTPATADNAEVADSSAIANQASTAPSAPIKTGTVRAEPSLRIHESPGTNTPVIYAAPNGTALNIYGETAMGDSLWYQVRAQSGSYPQQLGWAYGSNIAVDGNSRPVAPDQPTTPNADQGYRDGYKLGHRDGQNFKQYNSGYNPDGALQAGSGNPDPAYDQAFRRGFYAGFDAGYYGNPYNDSPGAGGSTPEPNVGNLTMTCSGSLSNGSCFTVNYTRESGFSRFTLDPGSASPVAVNLTYSGTTDAQHGVWKGSLGESEVRIDHLSYQPPKAGDEVSVNYNIHSGRAVCR